MPVPAAGIKYTDNFKMKKLLKLFTAADIGLIVILIVIAVTLFWQMKSDLQNRKIEIHQHNKLVGIFDSNKDQIIKLGSEAEVEIANGEVRIIKSSCKKQYCVQQGWSKNFPIICVPNEIAITFISKKEEMLITR
ncbi:MAG TPA: hypothetical protein ENL09_04605 [Bacteroidetes bacterium]|nr:hypothetical protein [Bacteroidota bacterium]